MALPLTRRQSEILGLIRTTIEDTGLPPTRAELAAALGVASPNAVEDHLKALKRKGMITMTPGVARGIRLVGETGIPVVGQVAAGSPLLAEESIERRLGLSPDLFTPPADYFLRVRGNSMVGAGILDGDLVAVRRTSEARNNQIVVARLDDEVTVKRYRPEKDGAWLVPENPEMQPIRVNPEEHQFVLEGVVVGVMRTAGV